MKVGAWPALRVTQLKGMVCGCLLVVGGGFVPARGSVITSADGIGGDGFVKSGTSGNANFSTGTFMEVKADQANGSGNTNRKSYVLFDLSTAGELPSATSASLTLTMNNNASSRVFNVFGLNEGTAGEIFSESTINYNNAPGNDHNSGGGPHDTNTMTGGGVNNNVTTFIGTFTATGGAGTQFTLSSENSPSLLTFLNADTNDAATFIITGATVQTGATDSICSGENLTVASRPTLSIVPEPTGVALAGVGLAALLARRRRGA